MNSVAPAKPKIELISHKAIISAVATLFREEREYTDARIAEIRAEMATIDKGQPDALFRSVAVRRLSDSKAAFAKYATDFHHRRGKVIDGQPPRIIAEALR